MIIITVYLTFFIFSVERKIPIEFETVSEIMGKYKEKTLLVFHWYTSDEIIAGQPTTVYVKAYYLPYNPYGYSGKDIQVRFEGTGYYADYSGQFFKIDSANTMVLLKPAKTSYDSDNFISNSTTLTYATGGKWGVWFCDYNLSFNDTCTKIPDVIEVSPHSTSLQLEMSRNNDSAVKVLVLLTIILVWLTLRQLYPNKKERDSKDISADKRESSSIDREKIITKQESEIKRLQILVEIESTKKELADLKAELTNLKSK